MREIKKIEIKANSERHHRKQVVTVGLTPRRPEPMK